MTPSAPKKLGRYLLHRLLGEGGMGHVYEAELCGPAGFRKRVALKVLKDGGEQLVREAKLGGLLRHANLVEVYELGWAKWEPPVVGDGANRGTWFCAMELVRGGSVGDLMPLSPRAVVDVGVQICAGLSHAHEQVGLIHLDLKPANILVDRGVVKVADLGISRAIGFTQDHKVRGTPGYMAPEQRQGGAIDARADVYALGVLLLTLSVGHRTQDPQRVPWLERVARKCLETDPNARYANTMALREALLALPADGMSLAETVGQVPSTSCNSRGPTRDTFAMTGGLRRTNLLPEADEFVGRLKENNQLQTKMSNGGIITLKGLGGAGKTRLSKRALRRFLTEHPAGQGWFCDLGEAVGPNDIVAVVADVLGVSLAGLDEQGRIQKVGHALAGRRDVVIVLDNFEQLVAHGSVIEAWWAVAPTVRFLVTSRERLGIRGEQLVELAPLPDADAIQLLVSRAQARGRDVGDDPALGELVRRLDGLPLALELAAARFGVLAPAQVLRRLDQRFRLLVGGQGVSTRHSTLWGTLAWSWDLLNPWQRDALYQLTVFRGGFSLESAEAVLDLGRHLDAPWALDAVSALLDRSLVVVSGTSTHPRFRLFESVRAFASTHGDDVEGLETRYCDHFAGLGAEDELTRFEGDSGRENWPVLAVELENLKYASNLAASRFQWGNAALSALGAANILQKRGPASQGFSLLGAVQLSTLAPTLRTRVLLAQAECAWVAGDHSQVARLAELVLSEERTDAQTRGRAWRLLGEAQVMACDNEAAMASLEHALCERTGGSATSDRVKALRTTGNLLVRQGKLDEALRRYTQAMNLLRRNPDRHAKGLMQVNLGVLASRRGKGDVALAHYRDAVQSLKGSGDAMVLGVALSNLGGLLSNQGKLEEALVHLEHALRLHSNAGARGRQVAALLMVGPVYWSAGDSESGYARAHRALALAEQLDAPLHLGNAHRILATFHQHEREYGLARQHLEQALVAYRRAGLQLWEHIWELSMGSLLLAEDQVASALTHFVSGLAGLNENSVGWLTALGGRAECRARLNQPEQAIADFDQAMAGSLGYPELSAELCLGRARVSSQLGESSEHWLAEAESYATQLGWSEKSPMRTQIDTMR